MKIVLVDFNTKVGREDILNQQFGMKLCTKLVMIIFFVRKTQFICNL
jgi:hypothetical protein